MATASIVCLRVHRMPKAQQVTLSMYTLIPTVYRALLKSAVSGTDHRIHSTKEKHSKCYVKRTFSILRHC